MRAGEIGWKSQVTGRDPSLIAVSAHRDEISGREIRGRDPSFDSGRSKSRSPAFSPSKLRTPILVPVDLWNSVARCLKANSLVL
ncbi:hypothetical protein PoB_003850700 [Plakobranchus ocellatus]|uniref:Uncharacterized protein n=1 Tax=Plakobranchus ocellatus TaxID=259542 RepID=A0AAV4AYL6_9GAST|nr:hypothetical protein PoB_003850700 [Plakobranchus ocellatus]